MKHDNASSYRVFINTIMPEDILLDVKKKIDNTIWDEFGSKILNKGD